MRRSLPCLHSGDADGVRASQVRHAVERVDGDVHLSCPALVRARAQPVAGHLLEPADRGFGSSANGVAGCFLPSRAAVLGNALQMTVLLRGRGLGHVARHGREPRRHADRRFWMTLGDCGRHAVPVVCTIGGERGSWALDLVEQGTRLGSVVDLLPGRRRRDDLPGVGVQANVQRPPGPTRFGCYASQPATRLRRRASAPCCPPAGAWGCRPSAIAEVAPPASQLGGIGCRGPARPNRARAVGRWSRSGLLFGAGPGGILP